MSYRHTDDMSIVLGNVPLVVVILLGLALAMRVVKTP
jgi:hypothetical protein